MIPAGALRVDILSRMRIVWMAVALACVLAAPVAAQHAKPTEAELKQAFVLHIRDGGVLLLPSKESLTLRDLYERIARAGGEFDKRTNAGSPVRTDLPVVLHVDDDVPWQHVQIVMEFVARWRSHRIWLARSTGGDGGVSYRNVWLRGEQSAVYRKTERGLVAIPAKVFPLFLIPMSTRPRAWETAGATIKHLQPTEVTYMFGPTEDAGTLSQAAAMAALFAAKARLENGAGPIRAILSALPQTPARLVIDSLRAFDRSLYPYVELLGVPFPETDEWDRHRLPFPRFGASPTLKASVIGGDPRQKFVVAPWAVEPGSSPAVSNEVRRIEGFDRIDSSVRLPLAAGVARDKGPWGENRLTINLTRRGELRARGHEFSLRSLGVLLRGLVTARKLDPKLARLRVLLRVDGDAPWGHVQTLLTEIKRSGIESVEFAVRAAATAGDSQRAADRFDVLYRPREADGRQHDGFFRLPLLELTGPLKASELVDAMRVIQRSELVMQAEREVETEWGPEGETKRVQRPLNVRFEWKGTRHYAIRNVNRAIVASRATEMGGMKLWSMKKSRVVVSASEKVPAKYVIACLARLGVLRWGEIWFFHRTEMSDLAREAAFLPYPDRDRPLRVLDGLEATAERQK